MQLEGKAGLSILEACDAARISRAGFYRHFDEHLPRQADTELRQQIQKICLDHRCYGSRRVIIELQKAGLRVNRKRVMRLMRADNLLCLRKRRFVCTTDSRHTYAIYPNLTRDWKPNGINQLWVADITYIRLRESFLYLAVILDAYSRRVIGWALGNTLEAELALAALRSALAERPAPASLVHHSRSRCPVLLPRLRRSITVTRYPHQYEPERQPLRQCSRGKLHAHSQMRRSLSEHLSRSR
jgi:putative transposase